MGACAGNIQTENSTNHYQQKRTEYNENTAEQTTPKSIDIIQCGYKHSICRHKNCKDTWQDNIPTKDKWLKSSKEMLWILNNTKPCPNQKCTKRLANHHNSLRCCCKKVEGGCNTLFCWTCLGDWAHHEHNTSGSNVCVVDERPIENIWNAIKILLDNMLLEYYQFCNDIPYTEYNTTITEVYFETGSDNTNEFILYQFAKMWLKKKSKQCSVDEIKCAFITSMVNFNTTTQNLKLLFYGYSEHIVYIPVDIVECCIQFYIDCATVDIKHELNHVLLSQESALNVQSDIPIGKTFIRNVWKLLVTNTYDNAHDGICFTIDIECMINNPLKGIIDYPIRYGICHNDLYSTLNSGDIIKILIINFNGDGLLKFAINDDIVDHKTTIFDMKNLTYYLKMRFMENTTVKLVR
eukprot:99347_1